MIVGSIVFGIITNNITTINETIINSSKIAFKLFVELFPVVSLWMGFLKISQDSGLLEKLSFKLSYLICKIFDELPKNHESIILISSNLIANFFGLSQAATPIGIKAMQLLKKLNKNKEEASNSMITFIMLNCCGITVFPTTIVSLRLIYGSNNPTKIIIPAFISTLISAIFGIMYIKIIKRRNKD